MKYLKTYEEIENPFKSVIKTFKDKRDARKSEKDRIAAADLIEAAKRKEAVDKHITRSQNLVNNKDAVIDCFQDVIDICQDHKVTANTKSIGLVFKSNHIVVNSQSKSERHRQGSHSTSFTFDEAHLVITDELVDIMIGLKEAMHLLKSIDEDIIIDTVFVKGKVKVNVSIKSGVSRRYRPPLLYGGGIGPG